MEKTGERGSRGSEKRETKEKEGRRGVATATSGVAYQQLRGENKEKNAGSTEAAHSRTQRHLDSPIP
ncbi:hypothetical protein U1Q18_037571, partial [Sarracenia purpurea var. burkii]